MTICYEFRAFYIEIKTRIYLMAKELTKALWNNKVFCFANCTWKIHQLTTIYNMSKYINI